MPLDLWLKFKRSPIQIYDSLRKVKKKKNPAIVVRAAAVHKIVLQKHEHNIDLTFNTITNYTLHKITQSHEINAKHIKQLLSVCVLFKWYSMCGVSTMVATQAHTSRRLCVYTSAQWHHQTQDTITTSTTSTSMLSCRLRSRAQNIFQRYYRFDVWRCVTGWRFVPLSLVLFHWFF